MAESIRKIPARVNSSNYIYLISKQGLKRNSFGFDYKAFLDSSGFRGFGTTTENKVYWNGNYKVYTYFNDDIKPHDKVLMALLKHNDKKPYLIIQIDGLGTVIWEPV